MDQKDNKTRFASPKVAITAWVNFVNQVVNGKYNGNENEYWNDLDTREAIEKMGYGNSEEVKKIDEDFKKTLVHKDVRVWGYDETRNDDWWNFGYPNTATGYLKSYFESSLGQ